jgi:exodeoxyribonuclease-5/deoxyribonuclease V
MKIAAVDVYYTDTYTKTVSVTADQTESDYEIHTSTSYQPVEKYIPGEFYKRELPFLLDVLNTADYDIVIVDSYVWLDDNEKPGLGKRLYDQISKPVIGVAKTHFIGPTECVREVLRGESKKPLYVTSIGFDLDKAAELIKNMKGEFRIPTMLKTLDQKTKS